jgi:hypothetical protein
MKKHNAAKYPTASKKRQNFPKNLIRTGRIEGERIRALILPEGSPQNAISAKLIQG